MNEPDRGLRSLDAIHLATARILRQDLDGSSAMTIACSRRRPMPPPGDVAPRLTALRCRWASHPRGPRP